MYGAAIWDRHTRTLTLARDPLGIKPLYVTQQRGGLAFGSEIRTLRALPDHDFTLNERAVHDFFSYGHVQRPRTFWQEVTSLDPGHTLTIGPEGDATVRQFWQPRFAPRHDLSEADWIAATAEQVDATVARHMLADVTVGAFLSGGVDSSAITAAMTRHATAPVKAFTVGFPGTSIDETAAAARIANHLGAEHIVLPLEPAAAGDLLPAVQAAFDEPCAATAAVPIWHLSRLAAEHVKVVLCGEGSDEIFAGYKRQRTALAAQRLRPYFGVLGPLMAAAEHLPGGQRFNYLRQNAAKFRNSALLDDNFQRFFAGTQISTPATRARLYDPGFYARQERPFAALADEYFHDSPVRDPLDQFMLADITVHMPGSLLNRLDRGSMAPSLEARVPFLSHKFVDWALTMPREMKLRGKVGKYALRQAVEPWLPPDALETASSASSSPSPTGSAAISPISRARPGKRQRRGGERLPPPEAVDATVRRTRRRQANHGRILYAIAMFGCWWDTPRDIIDLALREAAAATQSDVRSPLRRRRDPRSPAASPARATAQRRCCESGGTDFEAATSACLITISRTSRS